MTATPGERPADQLACRRITGRVQARHAGRTLFIDNSQAAGATYRALQAQGHREQLLKRINAQTIERQEEVRLRQAHLRLNRSIGLVQPRIHRLGLQRLGNHATALGRTCAFHHATVSMIKNRPLIER